jgi:hypothetical protein
MEQIMATLKPQFITDQDSELKQNTHVNSTQQKPDQMPSYCEDGIVSSAVWEASDKVHSN